jgi:hypothetical protein
MAGAESLAMYVKDEFALGPAEAFIDDHEFCHLPPPLEGSIHLTLPGGFLERVVGLGWAEAHPLAAVALSANLVSVYAPRDEQERDVIFLLVAASYRFARGKWKE